MSATENEVTWLGRKTTTVADKFSALRQVLPTFDRHPFGDVPTANPYLDVIVRRGGKRQPSMPVSIVSKDYELVQHTEVFDALSSALADRWPDPIKLEGRLRLSEFGERMHVSVALPCSDFNPGDGHRLRLRINCFNSVDRSAALETLLTWERLVCSNGMTVTVKKDLARQIHLWNRISVNDIKTVLEKHLLVAQEEHKTFSTWFQKPLTMDQIEQWADNDLANTWGVHAAARACNIARTGWDGNVEDQFVKPTPPPHARRIKPRREVPGAGAPVKNVYHLSQVLSWLARERQTVQDQWEYMWQIPGLLKPFLN